MLDCFCCGGISLCREVSEKLKIMPLKYGDQLEEL